MTNEKGNGVALGDGIFLNLGSSNTVTNNDLSSNHVFGISLYSSTGNTISSNTINDNDRIGVRLGPGSNDNKVIFNTISRNGIVPASGSLAESFPACGILIVSASGNQIYSNTFISQPNQIIGTGYTSNPPAPTSSDSPQPTSSIAPSVSRPTAKIIVKAQNPKVMLDQQTTYLLIETAVAITLLFGIAILCWWNLKNRDEKN
jgi:parallel beta-helix repeat protein